MHEVHVLFGHVFKAVFVPTSGPDVLFCKRFQEYWTRLDKKVLFLYNRLNGELKTLKMEAIEFIMDILNKKVNLKLPGEDYRELLQLSLIFLGEFPQSGINFPVTGAFHHARWLAKFIYILKIFLFQTEFKLTKMRPLVVWNFDYL
jgi:hypothetical protein